VSLEQYRGKRRFEQTPEPPGKRASDEEPRRKRASDEEPRGKRPSGGRGETARGKRPSAVSRGGEPAAEQSRARFVVHEHHARRLHWDLRLEHEGALASWAIPNGIPEDPAHNRKAVHVEDHPLEYIDFEGEIPSGNYGAGGVSIWDRGTYVCEKWEAEKVIVVFDGTRLRGRYALFHAGREPKDWMIHRMDPPADPDAEPMPEFVEPMLARLSRMPSDQAHWAFEVKWDGVRAIARWQPGRFQLLSRNRNDVTAAYPELRSVGRLLGSHEAILDGEVVAFDDDGKPSFQALQYRMHLRSETTIRQRAAETPVTYVIFDLLWLDGHPLIDLPYEQRRRRLAELELESERSRLSKQHVGDGDALLEATREQGLEGLVAKRLDSRYAPGRRDGGWLKIKHSRRQELVIGGWTDGKGARSQRIGALELGVYDTDGQLRYAGRVGTGFDEQELELLQRLLGPLARESSPFLGRQPARGAHFVSPELVCEVEFGEWTRDGRLRHPSYQGLRDDKRAVEVVREREQPPPEPVTRAGSPEPEPAPGLDELVANGEKVRGGAEIEVEGRTLKLTNLEKVLYPATGFTKRDLIAWYAAIAPTLLPHLRGRPLTLKRYPDGVDGKHFYEKQSPRHRPEWVQTVGVWSGHSKREVHYTLCEDLPTLLWLGNLADVELHPSLSLAHALEAPTSLAFDLDPGARAGLLECCKVALELRETFAQLGLEAFAKTSGSKGMQVYVPLNDEAASYEQTKPFAHAVANLFEQRMPELVVSEMAKAQRAGKVLIDWSQNDAHKTTICVYSLRAKERPEVSTPLSWEEVTACADGGEADALRFAPDAVLARVTKHGDLFAEVLARQQRLPQLANAGV
jgi:bifunctional non-homologous end joining protein LigD